MARVNSRVENGHVDSGAAAAAVPRIPHALSADPVHAPGHLLRRRINAPILLDVRHIRAIPNPPDGFVAQRRQDDGQQMVGVLNLSACAADRLSQRFGTFRLDEMIETDENLTPRRIALGYRCLNLTPTQENRQRDPPRSP